MTDQTGTKLKRGDWIMTRQDGPGIVAQAGEKQSMIRVGQDYRWYENASLWLTEASPPPPPRPLDCDGNALAVGDNVPKPPITSTRELPAEDALRIAADVPGLPDYYRNHQRIADVLRLMGFRNGWTSVTDHKRDVTITNVNTDSGTWRFELSGKLLASRSADLSLFTTIRACWRAHLGEQSVEASKARDAANPAPADSSPVKLTPTEAHRLLGDVDQLALERVAEQVQHGGHDTEGTRAEARRWVEWAGQCCAALGYGLRALDCGARAESDGTDPRLMTRYIELLANWKKATPNELRDFERAYLHGTADPFAGVRKGKVRL